MAAEQEPQMEIGHVLFIDIVGYSKLLIEEQKERLDQLTKIVLGRRRCATRRTNKSLGCRPAMGWRWSFATARRSRRVVRLRLRKRSRRIRRLGCGWESTAGR